MTASLLEKTLNRMLTLDPQKQHILALTGYHPLTIEITDARLMLNIFPDQNKITITEGLSENQPKHQISGKLFDLITLILSKDLQKLIQDGKILLKGDPAVLIQYQKALKAFKIDPIPLLRDVIGPIPLSALTQPFRKMRTWIDRKITSDKTDLSEWLHEEERLFPPAEMMQDFFDDIRTLTLDTDRLTAKLAALKTPFLISP
jgi:ubiquinone biosynthesis accessory factor UbiJ